MEDNEQNFQSLPKERFSESPESLERAEVNFENSENERKQELGDIEREIAANIEMSKVLEAEIVNQLPDFAKMPREKGRVDLGIASYLQEKGIEKVMDIYHGFKMGEKYKQELKQAIATGDLRTVIHLIELYDPVRIEAEEKMHKPGEDDDEFIRVYERGGFSQLDKNNALFQKHWMLGNIWAETGIPPKPDIDLPGNPEDPPEVRKKLAEMPLDMQNILGQLDSETRRSFIRDEVILESDPDKLYQAFLKMAVYIKSGLLFKNILKNHPPRKD